MKKLLFLFDTDPYASVFDTVVAYDGGADRVDHRDKHNRNGRADFSQCPHGRLASGQNNIGRERSQFCGVSAKTGGASPPPDLD